MKTNTVIITAFLALATQMMSGQGAGMIEVYDKNYRDVQHFYNFNQSQKSQDELYEDIEGSPYLTSEFIEGALFLKDSTAVKLPLRFNIYANEMEYQLKGVNYSVGNPAIINRVLIGQSVFIYLFSIQNGGYFEILESGRCLLLQKRSIKYKPSEGPKPIEGTAIPAKFIPAPDIFYMLAGDSRPVKIDNMKNVLEALQDQQQKVENYLGQENIKKAKKEDLIKIVKYYNSL